MRKRPSRPPWLESDRAFPRLVARPVVEFLNTEVGGGVVLLAAAVVALVIANSPFAERFEDAWHTKIPVGAGDFRLNLDLRHWINDGFMAIFFFVVGLEIKRELVVGELNDVRKAALPALAAVGGMVVPALLYLSLNAGGPGAGGWGIPMATDIAFAVGVLAVLGKRIPAGLKVFVLSLAIVDDIGAIAVIALFYSDSINLAWLAGAGILLAAITVMYRVSVRFVLPYAVVGATVWLAMFLSGVHATIAGVAVAFCTPARMTDDIERELHPWTSRVVIPLFALANAGVVLTADQIVAAMTSAVGLGVAGGLVVGKLVGIAGMAWLAVKANIASLPRGVAWHHVVGGAAVAGIGFTVSLFITALAFTDRTLVEVATVGILVGSLVAGIIGALILATPRESRDG